MPIGRVFLTMVSGVALGLLLCSAAAAADQRAGPDSDAAAESEADQPLPPAGEFRGPRPFGPGGPRAAGRPGDARANRPGQPHRPGPNAGGPPVQPGPGKQFGPRRPGHPGGPPRWPHYSWDALEQRDPEMYKLLKADHDLERETRELAMQFRRAPGQQRSAIRERVGELVGKHFEVRQQRRRLELKRLEEELKRLRDAIERRNQAREEIVRKHVSELLGEDNLDF